MKKTFRAAIPALLLGLAVALSGCEREQTGYTIKGEITGDIEGKMVYLAAANRGFGPAGNVLDSTVISNGRFEFKSATPAGQQLDILFPAEETAGEGMAPSRPVIPIFVETGTVTIKAAYEDIQSPTYADGPYDYSKLSITGSKLHDFYVGYASKKLELAKNRHQAEQGYWEVRRAQFPGSVSESIASTDKLEEAIAAQKAYIEEFVSKNRDNVLSAYALNDNFLDPIVLAYNIDMFTLDETDRMLASLSTEVKESGFGRALIESYDKYKLSAVDAKFVDFTFLDTDDNPVKLSEYVGKGKYVLLEFGGSWCGPCFSQVPFHKEMYEAYHPQGFEMISISIEFAKEEYLKALEDRLAGKKWTKLYFISKSDDRSVNDTYSINSVPTCVLVGPDGTIVHRSTGGPWVAKKLIEIYGNHFGDKY